MSARGSGHPLADELAQIQAEKSLGGNFEEPDDHGDGDHRDDERVEWIEDNVERMPLCLGKLFAGSPVFDVVIQ